MKKIILLFSIVTLIVSCKKEKTFSKEDFQAMENRKDSITKTLPPDEHSRLDVKENNHLNVEVEYQDSFKTVVGAIKLEVGKPVHQLVKTFIKTSIDFVNFAFERDSGIEYITTFGYIIDKKKPGYRVKTYSWYRDSYNKNGGKMGLLTTPLAEILSKMTKEKEQYTLLEKNDSLRIWWQLHPTYKDL